MKKIVVIVVLLMAMGCSVASAQRRQFTPEQIEAFKARGMEMLKKDLKLTKEQEVAFDPAFNKYVSQIEAIRKAMGTGFDQPKAKTGEEAAKQQCDNIDRQIVELSVKKKFYEEMATVLTPEQFEKLGRYDRMLSGMNGRGFGGNRGMGSNGRGMGFGGGMGNMGGGDGGDFDF